MPPRPRPFFPDNLEKNTEMDQKQSQEQEKTILQAQILETQTSHNPFQSVTPSLTNKIKLPGASKFDGTVSEYQSFLKNMIIFFYSSPELFAADASKILYIGTHLQGTASDWFGTLVLQQLPCLQNYEAFIEEFGNNFSDPSYARDSGFDNITLVDQFLRGFSPKIMQDLMFTDLPNSLEETIKISVRVDNRIYTMDQINCSQPQERSINPFVNHQPVNSLTNEIGKNQENTVYMEIDAISSRPRGPLTESEKTRRYDLRLCLYCGGKGHIALNCCRRKFPGKFNTQQ
ncbi:Retrotransposon-derived protein PEG10 [Smittium culicis]|uniref:Retrotransposon-derived protein PEG10 n=1 Tax=Smittium culicis TaxID=133412 RepID=A0A1R1XCM1_9FUNG|nr:Retrotransposon-derived protein PEG10 [Smittium culicis]